MDWVAHATANLALGNERGAAAIEISIAGIDLMCELAPVQIAYAGGDFAWIYNGKRLPNAAVLRLEPGDSLSVKAGSWGAWAYVALHGGVDVPLVLGSRSTHAKSQIGGLDGRALAAGDVLRSAHAAGAAAHDGVQALIAAPWLDPSMESLRVILGPQDDYFEASSIQALFEESFSLAPRFDRMAYWLNGPTLKHSLGFNIVSDGIALGAIQVVGSGQLIVLMADRQSTGGYPKIANVIRSDIGRVAQKRPGEQMCFRRCDPVEAREILLKLESNLDAFADVLRPAGSFESGFLLACNLISGATSGVQ
jgi:biotin-dependent carboxylase-like uncharacterized protein